MNISSRYSNPNLTFIAFPILGEKIICRRWFLFGVSYYVNFKVTP